MSQINISKSSFRLLSPAVLLAVTGLSAPAMADFTYTDFVTTPNLQFNGVATQYQNAISVTPPVARAAGSVWHTNFQSVSNGFTTDFTFRVRDKSGIGSDGFAFLIQNSFNPTVGLGATNTGINALGVGGGALGYASNLAFPASGTGINNSVAVEFDLFKNTEWDDFNSDNHISVHTMGALANQPNAATSLGHVVSNAGDFWNDMGDGSFYDVRLVYTPGTLALFMKKSTTMAFGSALLSVPLVLDSSISLAAGPGGVGQALVGFTSGTGGAANVERHEITKWSFSSNVAPRSSASR